MYDQRVIYELVWRIFKNTLIHEDLFRFETDKPLTWGKRGVQLNFFSSESVLIEPIRPIGFLGGHSTHHWRPNRHFLCDGFPLPEQGGVLFRRGAFLFVRIFMDDVFLCPDCGGFDSPQPNDCFELEWLDPHYTQLDVLSVVDAVEERRNAREFEIRKCKHTESCPDFVNEEQRRRNREAEQEQARQAALALYQEELKKRAEEESRKATERVETAKPNPCVYLVGTSAHPGLVKIGVATDVRRRVKSLQTSCPFSVELVKHWISSDPLTSERKLHSKYARHRQTGEWFRLPDHLLETLISVDDLDKFLKRKPSR